MGRNTSLACIAAASLLSCGKPAATGGGEVTVNGSGSTFQKQFQEEAISAFAGSNPKIHVNYGGGGSGKGRQDFADMVTDYGCSDAPFKDADKAKIKGGDFVYVPIVLGAITISFRIDGVDKLQLSADTIAKIFQRDIKKWNDPAIAADNPGATLPDADIVVVHRADGSGTTEQLTKFLATAATATWRLKSGPTVEWPPETQAGQGNGGVAQLVKSTPGAIGYIDLPDAKAAQLHYASIKNAAGKLVEPTAQSAQAAGSGITISDDLTFSALDSKADGAYPITAASWCMAYTKPHDAAKAAALKAYFKFMVTDAQKLAPTIDFAPLPQELQSKAIAQVDKLAG
jgi:phosphate transport system substrate-binding protein